MTPEKIGPALLTTLEDYREEGRQGLNRTMRTLGVVSAVNSPKPPRSVVFLRCAEDANFEHLTQLGIRVNQPTGRVRTGIVPLDALDPLSDEAAVESILEARYLRIAMDVAPGKVNLPAFRTNGLSGAGVVIGVVDTGIDPNHPAFAGRILRIWDQEISGPGVAEGGYGAELQASLLSVSRDRHGHGTHVAGIASSTDAIFGGVAPRAELVIVKTDLMDAHIADGIRYIFRVAGDLGRPAVVNLSLGGHGDAHDGSDSLSQVIDGESGPGRIVCCAAGNEGNDNIHGRSTIPGGTTRSIRFHVPADSMDGILVNGWYPGARTCEIAIRSPGGFQTAFQPVIAAGNPVRSYALSDARVRITTPGPDPANGDHNFLVELLGPTSLSAVPGGVWRLRVRNTSASEAQLDAWILDGLPAPEALFTGSSISDAIKVGSPGAATAAVTVASYTTKVQWTDVGGSVRSVAMDLDDISDFSSEGPLRDGSPKPDVAAPGAMIVSCLSADSLPEPSSVVNVRHRVMAGTSMATPFMTGVVALLLERDGTIDPPAVKALLRAHSAIPGRPAGTFDAKWGFGLIDALGL